MKSKNKNRTRRKNKSISVSTQSTLIPSTYSQKQPQLLKVITAYKHKLLNNTKTSTRLRYDKISAMRFLLSSKFRTKRRKQALLALPVNTSGDELQSKSLKLQSYFTRVSSNEKPFFCFTKYQTQAPYHRSHNLIPFTKWIGLTNTNFNFQKNSLYKSLFPPFNTQSESINVYHNCETKRSIVPDQPLTATSFTFLKYMNDSNLHQLTYNHSLNNILSYSQFNTKLNISIVFTSISNQAKSIWTASKLIKRYFFALNKLKKHRSLRQIIQRVILKLKKQSKIFHIFFVHALERKLLSNRSNQERLPIFLREKNPKANLSYLESTPILRLSLLTSLNKNDKSYHSVFLTNFTSQPSWNRIYTSENNIRLKNLPIVDNLSFPLRKKITNFPLKYTPRISIPLTRKKTSKHAKAIVWSRRQRRIKRISKRLVEKITYTTGLLSSLGKKHVGKTNTSKLRPRLKKAKKTKLTKSSPPTPSSEVPLKPTLLNQNKQNVNTTQPRRRRRGKRTRNRKREREAKKNRKKQLKQMIVASKRTLLKQLSTRILLKRFLKRTLSKHVLSKHSLKRLSKRVSRRILVKRLSKRTLVKRILAKRLSKSKRTVLRRLLKSKRTVLRRLLKSKRTVLRRLLKSKRTVLRRLLKSKRLSKSKHTALKRLLKSKRTVLKQLSKRTLFKDVFLKSKRTLFKDVFLKSGLSKSAFIRYILLKPGFIRYILSKPGFIRYILSKPGFIRYILSKPRLKQSILLKSIVLRPTATRVYKRTISTSKRIKLKHRLRIKRFITKRINQLKYKIQKRVLRRIRKKTYGSLWTKFSSAIHRKFNRQTRRQRKAQSAKLKRLWKTWSLNKIVNFTSFKSKKSVVTSLKPSFIKGIRSLDPSQKTRFIFKPKPTLLKQSFRLGRQLKLMKRAKKKLSQNEPKVQFYKRLNLSQSKINVNRSLSQIKYNQWATTHFKNFYQLQKRLYVKNQFPTIHSSKFKFYKKKLATLLSLNYSLKPGLPLHKHNKPLTNANNQLCSIKTTKTKLPIKLLPPLTTTFTLWSNLTMSKYLIYKALHPSNKLFKHSVTAVTTSISTANVALKIQNQLNSYCFGLHFDQLRKSNIWIVTSSNYLFQKKLLQSISQTMFQTDITTWAHKCVIQFAENISGRKVGLYMGPFIEQALTPKDHSQCYIWGLRSSGFKNLLGHRIFISEAIMIVAASFRLKDPTLLSNWICGMLTRMSFWKYRVLFRYLKFLVQHLFRFSFSDFQFKGLKLRLKGKISVGGNSRSRVLFYRIGDTSHSKADNKIAYHLNYVYTFTGVMGLKIWFFY